MPTANDGELEIPTTNESEISVMAIDLSPNVANQLLTETVGNIQGTNNDARASAQLANAHLRFAASRNFDEVGVNESRAVSGVMATPVASPAVQQG